MSLALKAIKDRACLNYLLMISIIYKKVEFVKAEWAFQGTGAIDMDIC